MYVVFHLSLPLTLLAVISMNYLPYLILYVYKMNIMCWISNNILAIISCTALLNQYKIQEGYSAFVCLLYSAALNSLYTTATVQLL